MRRTASAVAWTGLLTAYLLPASALPGLVPELDSEIERCLSEGEIVKKLETLVGVTKPELFQIECDGELRPVLFKSLDLHRRGITRLEGGGTELGFSDSYKYERAAYLLDRELEIRMVPAAVIRSIKGDEGAIVQWIDRALPEAELTNRPTGPQVAELARQKALMRLFDALILNVDRRPGNWLVDAETFRLYLIDHSRAFRTRTDLHEEFLSRRARLSKGLYRRLRELDEDRLTTLLGGLVDGRQIRALLSRRDRILEKIDRDRGLYGDAAVFSE